MGFRTRHAPFSAALFSLLTVGSLIAGAAPAAAMSDAGATASSSVATSATLVGAGDIASCSSNGDSETAALIANIPGTVFTTGDNVYPDGALANYSGCYAPAWGVFKSRTKPVPGNHDYYHNPGAKGYFDYFGRKAGPYGRGYYRYDRAGWRIYALDSEFAPTSTAYAKQLSWLKADLRNYPHECVLAMWHRPRWSTGPHGNSKRMASVLTVLYNRGAEIVLTGHDHMYERYTPLDPAGTPDPVNGIRQFVVGTGGAATYQFETEDPNVDVRDNSTNGVLQLTLTAGAYAWQFIPTTTGGFTDSGSGTCH